MNNTYHIEDNLIGHLLKCNKCGKKILVEILLFGVSHNLDVIATCGSCMKISDNIKEKYPEVSKKIEEFLNEKEIN